MQKSSVLSEHLNYNKLKVIIEFLPNDNKNKLPTPASRQESTLRLAILRGVIT